MFLVRSLLPPRGRSASPACFFRFLLGRRHKCPTAERRSWLRSRQRLTAACAAALTLASEKDERSDCAALAFIKLGSADVLLHRKCSFFDVFAAEA